MSTLTKQIACGTHGEANETFVCVHLATGKASVWNSPMPDRENPWPDAWCDECHAAYAAEGEWDAKSEAAAQLKARVLCHHCYEALKNSCEKHVL